MIFGIFLRHYKCYKNLHYIPFTTRYNASSLNLIIGKNGSGKTSVLEVLNAYFNKSTFNLSHNEKRLDAYITPIFCVEKEFIDKINIHYSGSKSELTNLLNTVSEFLWDIKGASNSKPQQSFTELKDNISDKFKREAHYLLIDGIDIEGNLKLGPFDEELRSKLLEITDNKKITSFFNAIRSSFKYIFIPVETDLNDYLRLENNSLQYLIGQDVKKKIDDIFDKKVNIDGSDKKIISIINENLTQFVRKVEGKIQIIDENYSFRTDPNVKRSVTSKDLRGKVIEEYFRNRTLKRNETKISHMSSGQRKKALIDIIYSLLIDNNETDDRIILGIDEPESSLDVTNCFDQFEKIEKIAQNNIQTLVTTHWYGALPIVRDAIISHTLEIDKNIEIKNFASSNLYDNHDAHRIEDIFFKSIYDLASSILASLRNGTKDWIIVEGHSDKIYLESYFDLEKVNFLSIGGIDRLISLVDFLSVPLRNKTEKNYSNNKIVFLSDNDMEYKSSLTKPSNILYFKRYVFKNGEIKLIDYTKSIHGEEIRIEDVMDSKTMYDSLLKLSKDNPDLKSILKEFAYQKDFKISKFGGDFSFLETSKNGSEKVKLMTELKAKIEPLKTRLALIYKDEYSSDSIKWVDDLKSLLKN